VSVVQGSTDNLVEVTLQNMGNQDVGSFDVTVSDETAASEIGTETVSDGLSAGGSTVLTFSWNVSLDATLGEHELGAYHSVTDDDDTTNDQGTTWATVVASLSDVAVTAVSAPTSVVQGSTGNLVEVTVKNMGNQDVGSFDVTLSDETATYQIGTETVSEGLNAGASTIVSFSWDLPLDAAVGEHQLLALHNLSDDVEGNDSETTMVEIVAQTSAGPYLWTRKISATTAGWETVNLDNDHDYGQNMVVICTPNYEYHALLTPEPLMAHVQNASGSSFQVKLVQAVGGSIQDVSTDVHCMVVEAGIYTLAEHGVKMEAVKFDSTITDGSGSWVGENRSYSNSYTNPVVVGQVMSLNSYDYTFGVDLWSAFWCRGSSSKNPPSSTILRVGKHDGEDPRTRELETIGYVVMEAGSGSIGSTSYVAGVSSDTIRGVGDKPPYYYPLDGITSPLTAVAILSQAAMDGGNGSWAILYGNDPITASGISLAVDEDMAIDYERRHTSEQVGYIVFE
jgi:hypothetical protein